MHTNFACSISIRLCVYRQQINSDQFWIKIIAIKYEENMHDSMHIKDWLIDWF